MLYLFPTEVKIFNFLVNLNTNPFSFTAKGLVQYSFLYIKFIVNATRSFLTFICMRSFCTNNYIIYKNQTSLTDSLTHSFIQVSPNPLNVLQRNHFLLCPKRSLRNELKNPVGFVILTSKTLSLSSFSLVSSKHWYWYFWHIASLRAKVLPKKNLRGSSLTPKTEFFSV